MTDPATRGGSYQRQPHGYRAFIPADLPPVPPISMDGGLQAKLARADLALARLAGAIETLPNPEPVVFISMRKEAVESSRIENTHSTLPDLLSAEGKLFDPERPKDVEEVVNYVAAMNHGLRSLERLPLSVELIRESHAALLASTRRAHLMPGELRRTQTWIGPAGHRFRDATFVPPPPGQMEVALGQLERFLHGEDDLPPLVKIGLAHCQFETIHPFMDGNGLMGRLLITLFLREQKILPQPVLCLSHYFNRHRQRYYDLLQGTRDTGDFEAWLMFFLDGVAEMSLQAIALAKRLVLLRETHRDLIVQHLGRSSSSGHRVLDHLYTHPIISVPDVGTINGTTYPAANQLVERLSELGIITEATGSGRNRRYRYDAYVQVITDPEDDVTADAVPSEPPANGPTPGP